MVFVKELKGCGKRPTPSGIPLSLDFEDIEAFLDKVPKFIFSCGVFVGSPLLKLMSALEERRINWDVGAYYHGDNELRAWPRGSAPPEMDFPRSGPTYYSIPSSKALRISAAAVMVLVTIVYMRKR